MPSVDGLVLATSRLGDAQIKQIAARKPAVVINRALEGVTGDPARRRARRRPARRASRRARAPLGRVPVGSRDVVGERGGAGRRCSPPRRSSGMTIVEIGPGVPTLDGGAAAISRVVASGVTAVVAFNDLMAIGLLQGRAGTRHRRAVEAQHRRLRRHLRQRLHAPGPHDRARAAHRGGRACGAIPAQPGLAARRERPRATSRRCCRPSSWCVARPGTTWPTATLTSPSDAADVSASTPRRRRDRRTRCAATRALCHHRMHHLATG